MRSELEIARIGRAPVSRHARTCPACGVSELRRVKHEAWAAWIPLSKFYSCSKCKTNFLRLFNYFQIKVKTTGGSSKNRNREYMIVGFAIAVTIYVCYRIVASLYDAAPNTMG